MKISGFIKRMLPLLGCIFLMFAVSAASPVLAESGNRVELDGLVYLLEKPQGGDDCGTAVVVDHNSEWETPSVEIPEEIEIRGRKGKVLRYRITGIADGAFAMCSFETIRLPEGLVSISGACFYHSSCLKELIIPASVENIGAGAFSYCPVLSLKVNNKNPFFTVRSHVLYSKDMTVLMYADAYARKRLVIPEGVKEIAPYAFEGNSTLIRVVMPKTLKKIGMRAFFDCRALERADIPASVEEIDGNPFAYCAVLSKITVNRSNNNYYAASNGLLLSADKRHLISASAAAGSVSIPAKVYYIDDLAATGNTRITHVTFSKRLKSIGEAAFYDCTGLESIFFSKCGFTFKSVKKVFGNCAYHLEASVPYKYFNDPEFMKGLKKNLGAGAITVTR
ncbi:MAG: leucine-rich repeat domain-containing protein [Lachnospiraceae bacterium]|nr:leucine-rich repeat domain-containing protein [Lachnospiraceae bacterium]